MDPGRKAMIAGRRSPTRRDVTSPRHDPTNRITKSTKPSGSKINPKYLTQDEQSRQFVADEDKFVLKQSKKKADIRIREGRAKPIDYLAFNLRYIDTDRDIFDDDDADIEIDVPAPGDVVASLDAEQIAELESDIASYHVLETNATNREYWRALQTICKDRKAKLDPHGHERRVVSSVSDDIDKILAPKTHDQLEALEKQIKAKLQSNEDIDTDYWEQLLRSLRVWKARAKLNQVYEAIQETRLNQLKERDPTKVKASGQPTSAPKVTFGSQPVPSASEEKVSPAPVSSSRHGAHQPLQGLNVFLRLTTWTSHRQPKHCMIERLLEVSTRTRRSSPAKRLLPLLSLNGQTNIDPESHAISIVSKWVTTGINIIRLITTTIIRHPRLFKVTSSTYSILSSSTRQRHQPSRSFENMAADAENHLLLLVRRTRA
ncbi:hypothetical protein NW765_001860 [Fusarium oxysporum]|nr:hypothetical protein NW765_001860 [Fusarium oxysporum]